MSRLWLTQAVFFLVLALSAGSVYAVNSGSSGAGVSAQQSKEALLERVRPRAKRGVANAQYNLGVIYDRGYGVERNYDKARKWYKKAAAQGYAKAAHNLGVMYQRGHGVPVNHERAAYWFKQAAKQGEPASMNNLAVMYARGLGVEQNMRKAAIWAARAAQAGNGSAIANISLIVAEFPRATISGDNVNIRSKPTTDGSVVLKQANSGTEVVLLQQRSGWSQILFTSDYVVGWVANFLIKTGSVAASAGGGVSATGRSVAVASAAQTTRSDTTTSDAADSSASVSRFAYDKTISSNVANVRKRPTTQSPVLFQAQHGDRLTILKSNQYGWKYVRFKDGRTGWIAGFLLEDA